MSDPAENVTPIEAYAEGSADGVTWERGKVLPSQQLRFEGFPTSGDPLISFVSDKKLPLEKMLTYNQSVRFTVDARVKGVSLTEVGGDLRPVVVVEVLNAELEP